MQIFKVGKYLTTPAFSGKIEMGLQKRPNIWNSFIKKTSCINSTDYPSKYKQGHSLQHKMTNIPIFFMLVEVSLTIIAPVLQHQDKMLHDYKLNASFWGITIASF